MISHEEMAERDPDLLIEYLELWTNDTGLCCISATRLDGKGRMHAQEIRKGGSRNLARAALELAIHLEADR